VARLINRILSASGALGGLQLQQTTRRHSDDVMVRSKQPPAGEPSAAQQAIRDRFTIASEILFTLGNATEFHAFSHTEPAMTGRNVLQRWVDGWIRDGGPHTPRTFRGQNILFPFCQIDQLGGGYSGFIRLQGDWGRDVSDLYPITIFAFTCDPRNIGPGERRAAIGSAVQNSQAWLIDLPVPFASPWQNAAWIAEGWCGNRAVYSHAQWVQRGSS